MKNRIATIIAAVSVLLIILVIALAYMFLHYPNKMSAIDKITAKAPVLHSVIVLDFDNDGALNEHELTEGQDAIILVNNPEQGINEPFDSTSALQKLDVNKDGIIDEKDPLYRYMELMFFEKEGKARRIVSFASAGIKSIKIDQKRLGTQRSVTVNAKENSIGQATLSNGQQYAIRMIEVSAA